MKWLQSGTRTSRPSRITTLLLCLSLAGLPSLNVRADTTALTLPRLLQQVLDHYPSLQTAALQIEKAQQESTQIESRLGWQLGAQGGISQDVSLFGSAVSRISAGTHAMRQLDTGDTLSVSANIQRDDADTATLPSLPNPATSTNIELQYRKPLARGRDNTSYDAALTQASSNVTIQKATQQLAYDQIAAELISLYAATLTTQQRIDNIQQSIDRSQRLQRFILDRVDLGIAEDKDRLQISAQYHGLLAQKTALELALIKQNIALNRLMDQPWQTPLTLKLDEHQAPDETIETLVEQAKRHSPALRINDARMTAADSLIALQRDKGLNRLDLVLSLGNSSQSGDSPSGSVNNSELIGGVQFEYDRQLDRRGDRAALYQAQLDRSITVQDRKQIYDDLHYDIAMRVAELKAIQTAIKAYRRSVKSEHAKLDEAEQRYRQGRITIDQVIQFENQTAGSELGLALQQIDFQHSSQQLELLRGTLWHRVKLPSGGDQRDDQ
jgi:outer membrane protein TolC